MSICSLINKRQSCVRQAQLPGMRAMPTFLHRTLVHGGYMKKIAVIEDEAIVRESIVERLTEAGYDVVSTENGLLGIELIREELPDLVLCDVMMPGLGGFGVLEYIRKDPATELIPFVFLSALSEKSDLRRGMQSGADDYLTKPFSKDELLEAVQARLKTKQLFEHRLHETLEEFRESVSRSLPHEFLTPLNSIIGLSTLLHDHRNDFEENEALEMLRNINQAGQRLLRLVHNYLRFSELEHLRHDDARRSELLNDYVEAPDLYITQVASAIASRARRARDITIRVEDAVLRINARNLEKLVEELVDNACKFSLDGTPITITASPTEDWYEITVTDRGRGMTPEQIRSIGAYMQFDRLQFEQKGVGLGLALVHSIVDLHGGRISVQSQVGKSTTVSVLLPCEPYE
jgi:two-component system, sensor histidine kinase and response regulator